MKHTIMIDERSIAERVASLAEQICNDYKGKQIALVAVSNGAFIFAADLFRKLPHDTYLDSVNASSYKAAKRGELVLKETFNIDLNGKHVLLVDDILDSGVTLSNIAKYLKSLDVASLRTCVMLDKPEGRVCEFHADYIGFTIPNKYVYGYGMDDEFGLLRGCPYIGAKEEE